MSQRGADKVEKVVRAGNRPHDGVNARGLISVTTDKHLIDEALTQSGQVVRKVVRMYPETGRTDNTPPLGGVRSGVRAVRSEKRRREDH